MSSVTSTLLQPSGSLRPSTTVPRLTNRAAKLVGNRREIAPTTGGDLTLIYPDAVVASSQPLGWQNLRAFEMRQTISEWTTPPLGNHAIIIQLGSSIDVTALIGDESFKQTLQLGAITIVPAGLSTH